MTRFAMTREVDGGRTVPVAMRLIGAGESVVDFADWKYRTGTAPQVTGAMNEATAVWPG